MEAEEGCIVIQTCDKYHTSWPGLFWSMNRYWDYDIPWKIFFCNEEKEVELPNKKYEQLKTGRLSHSEMMSKIFSDLKSYKYIFYMLEDFWPTSPMTKEMFLGLFEIFKKNNWDSLKITSYQPHFYDLENTNFEFEGKKILRYSEKSKWRFNQQASFWKHEIFESVIMPPKPQDLNINTSLQIEDAMDERFRKLHPKAEVYLYNYVWYPISGVLWRGELTVIGKQIEFERNVEELIKIKFK